MNTVQQYKISGLMHGLTKVAARFSWLHRPAAKKSPALVYNADSNGFYTVKAGPKQIPASDSMVQPQFLKQMPNGDWVPEINVPEASSTAKALASAQPVTYSQTPGFQGRKTYTVNHNDLPTDDIISINSNPSHTKRRFRARLRDIYNKHPKLVIGGGVTAGTAALIAALSGGDTPAPALASVGPAAERKQPKRRYTQFGQGDVDRNHSNWDWYKKQFDDSAKGRAGALAQAAREQAAVNIPQHLRYRAALQQSFKDPNALKGTQGITSARLAHAARQQAIEWLKHLGIPASEYNVSQMAKYFSDYSRFAQFGGMQPDVKQYFRHLDTINYRQALKTLSKWRKAISHGF